VTLIQLLITLLLIVFFIVLLVFPNVFAMDLLVDRASFGLSDLKSCHHGSC